MDLIARLRDIAPQIQASTLRKAWSDEARESARLARQAGVKVPPSNINVLRHGIPSIQAAMGTSKEPIVLREAAAMARQSGMADPPGIQMPDARVGNFEHRDFERIRETKPEKAPATKHPLAGKFDPRISRGRDNDLRAFGRESTTHVEVGPWSSQHGWHIVERNIPKDGRKPIEDKHFAFRTGNFGDKYDYNAIAGYLKDRYDYKVPDNRVKNFRYHK